MTPRTAVLPRALLRSGLRHLVRRPLQTGLLVFGVALGVAVVVAIDLASGSARRGFERSTEALAGRATHELRGGPSGLPEDLFRRLRADWGLRASAPVVEETVVALDLDRQPLHVLGIDPLSEGRFRSHVGGLTPASPAFASFLVEPDGAIVGSAMAARYGLRALSPIRLQVGDRFATVRVLGIVHPAEGEHDPLESLLLMDVGSAQRLLRMEGWLSRVDLILSPAEAIDLQARLPEGVRLVAAGEAAHATSQLTAAFELNLTALSLLALVVGMFLIYNTVTFGVVERRAALGTLRALGATPGQVFALVLAETAIASAVGTGLGLGLGYVLGQGATRLVTRTINDLYYALFVLGAPLTLASVGKAVVLGIGSGLASAVPPAMEAARVEPVTALRASAVESAARARLPFLALAGVVAVLGGGAALVVFPRSLHASFAGLFAVVVGAALLAPAATVLLMRVAGPIAVWAVGTLGRLAARTVTTSIARSGVAIAALMVAVSVTIGVSLMIASFRATVVSWLELTLRADVYVSAPRGTGPRGLALDVPARVAAVPGVTEIETLRAVTVGSPEGEVHLAVVDPRRERSAGLYRFAEGSPAETWRRVQEGAVLVTEPFAYRHRVPPHGGTVALETDRGPRVFPVAGIYYDYANERGTVLMARDVYERSWDDRAVSSLAVYVRPDASADEVADRLRTTLAGTALEVTANAALRATALRVFDRTFAVTGALRLLAVAVAFVGVMSALMDLQSERTRELATLLALGLTQGQLAGLMLLETGLMGLAAGILSLPVGALLALILVDVINVRSFGWTMPLVFTPGVFVQAMLVSLGAALLASVYPLLRLGRLPVAAALRQE